MCAEIRTASIMLQTLCVPCASRCRYCLLSWDGKTVGADYSRSEAFAGRLAGWVREHMPEVSFNFSFGYSMEHPELFRAIDFLRSIGSVGAEFLQLDGMKMRDAYELRELMDGLREHGVRSVNITVYGTDEYHDRFAGRIGDYRLLLRTAESAADAGMELSVGMPLTGESAPMADSVIDAFDRMGRVKLFVPHGEGRGALLEPIRFTETDYSRLSDRARARLNSEIYKPEAQWLQEGVPEDRSRLLIISLTPENISSCETIDPAELIASVERLDEAYYSSFPEPEELCALYGDPEGIKFYRSRDLLATYRVRHAKKYGIKLHDVTDERYSGSRRY